MKASIKQSIVYDMQYRLSFLLNMIISTAWAFLSYLSFSIVAENASTINSTWSSYESTLIYTFFAISTFIVYAVFKRNIERIPDRIVKGDLDRIITKPANSKFLASIGYTRLGNIPSILYILIIAIQNIFMNNSIDEVPLTLLTFFIMLIFTSWSVYSIFVTLLTLSFWLTGAYNLNIFYNRLASFGFYPIKAFGGLFTLFFTIVFPLIFVGTFPAESIYENSFLKGIAAISASISLHIISNWIWNKGLRQYQSASS